jgi:hypothetical protein
MNEKSGALRFGHSLRAFRYRFIDTSLSNMNSFMLLHETLDQFHFIKVNPYMSRCLTKLFTFVEKFSCRKIKEIIHNILNSFNCFYF